MDNLKRLELEYEGIRGTILDYTSEGNIVNFLDGLKKQIDIKDIEAITYYINEICAWYEKNINQIYENEFVVISDEDIEHKLISNEEKNRERGKENVFENFFES